MTQNPSKELNKSIYVQKDMSQQTYLSPYEDDTIDLFELLITIWNWKWFIILIFLLGVFGSIGVTSILPRTYEASVLFLTEDKNALKRVASNPKILYALVKNENLSDILLKGITADKNPDSELTPEEQATEILFSENTLLFDKDKISKNMKGLVNYSLLTVRHKDAGSAKVLANKLPELLNLYGVNSEQNFHIEEKIKLQKQISKNRILQTGVLNEIENLGKEGAPSFSLQAGGNDISVMTQLKLRLGEKLADQAVASASVDEQAYQLINNEIKALENKIQEQEILMNQNDIMRVKLKAKMKIHQSYVNQEESLTMKLQSVSQRIIDLKNRRIEILSSATLPSSPIKPKTRMIVALSSVVSIFVGIFLVFVIEFIKNSKSRLKENEEKLSPA